MNMVKVFVSLIMLCPFFADAQCVSGNCKNGKGEMHFSNGAKYAGDFLNGMAHGIGILISSQGTIYKGQWIRNYQTGRGIKQYPDGRRYKGYFNQNKKEGEGTMYYPDGRVYSGDWIEDEPVDHQIEQNEGFVETVEHDIGKNKHSGEFVYEDGSRYEGEMINGLPEGTGTCYYVNGDIYNGGWSGHAPHGEGVMHFNDGYKLGAKWEYGKVIEKVVPKEERPVMKTNQNMFDEQVSLHALIVGVASYEQMPSLKYTDDDAYRFYAFLKSPEGGAVSDERLHILIDEDATREKILNALQSIADNADENDVVMLYISGHGLVGSFLPVDFDGYNNRINYEEINEILATSRAKHKVCLADACHSGSLLSSRSLDEHLSNYYLKWKNLPSSVAFILSSGENEVSLEHSGMRQGIFSHFLMQGLKGDADTNRDQLVTVSELFSFIRDRVREYSNNVQSPVIAGNYNSQMPLALLR